MKKSFMENPHRYQYAPRTLSEAFKDVEYATPIHVYKEEDTSFFTFMVCAVLIVALIGVAIYFNN